MEYEVSKAKLKDYAAKLMFDMDDSEYETLQEEFRTILKQMDLIENIPNIKDVQPMSFPFIKYEAHLRKDEVILDDTLTVNEVLTNCKHQYNDQVKLPKVVE